MVVFVLAFEIQPVAYTDSSSQFLGATCFNVFSHIANAALEPAPSPEWRRMLEERGGTKGGALKSRYKKREKTSPKNTKNNTNKGESKLCKISRKDKTLGRSYFPAREPARDQVSVRSTGVPAGGAGPYSVFPPAC